MGIEIETRPTFISLVLHVFKITQFKGLFIDFKDYFAWSYKETLGLSHNVVVHKLGVSLDINPIK